MTGTTQQALNAHGSVHNSLLTVRNNALSCYIVISALLLFSILFTSCSHSIVAPVDSINPSLEVEDVSTHKAWIRLKLDNVVPGYYYFLRDSTGIYKGYTKPAKDTVHLMELLKPGKEYEIEYAVYDSANYDGTKKIFSSGKKKFRTLEETNSNFTFQHWVFDSYNFGSFEDVSIVNENEIYVTGGWDVENAGRNNQYGLMRWDGNSWTPYQVLFPSYCGYIPTSPKNVMAHYYDTSYNKLFMVQSSAQQVAVWQGTGQYANYCNSGSEFLSRRIFKTLNNYMLIIGAKGGINWFNGTNWTSISAPQNIDFTDGWNDKCSRANEEVLLLGGSNTSGAKPRLMRFEDGNLTDFPLDSSIRNVSTVWFKSKRVYYVGGERISTYYPDEYNAHWSSYGIPSGKYIYKIRGDGYNNLASCGSYGTLHHFNGSFWISLTETLGLQTAELYSVAIKGRIVVACGELNGKPLVVMGRRP